MQYITQTDDYTQCTGITRSATRCARQVWNAAGGNSRCWQHEKLQDALTLANLYHALSTHDEKACAQIFRERTLCAGTDVWCVDGIVDYYKYICITSTANIDIEEWATLALDILYNTGVHPTNDHLRWAIEYYEYISDECLRWLIYNTANADCTYIRKLSRLADRSGDSEHVDPDDTMLQSCIPPTN